MDTFSNLETLKVFFLALIYIFKRFCNDVRYFLNILKNFMIKRWFKEPYRLLRQWNYSRSIKTHKRKFSSTLHSRPGLNADYITKLRRLTRTSSRMCKLRSGLFGYHICVYDPKIVKFFLTNTAKKHKASVDPTQDFLQNFIANGLPSKSNDGWVWAKDMLKPGFNNIELVDLYLQRIDSCARVLTDKWLLKCEGEPTVVEVFEDLGLSSLHALFHGLFSYDLDLLEELDTSYPLMNLYQEIAKHQETRNVSCLKKFFRWFTKREQHYLSLRLEGKEEIGKMLLNRLTETKPDQPAIEWNDMLDVIIFYSCLKLKISTIEQKTDEVSSIIEAGHQPIASAISWTLYCLAKNPTHQIICQSEVAANAGHLSIRPYYLVQCIKESLRMFSPVPIITQTVERNVRLGKVKLLAGTPLHILIDTLHHNPYFWGKDHYEFNPDRFDPTTQSNNIMDYFCPFGKGPRQCMENQMEMLIITKYVTKILQNFNLSISKSSPKARPVPLGVMKSLTGIHIKLTRRTKIKS